MLEELTFKSLGVVNYHETLDLMKSHIKSNNFKNEIWLLEHPPIFTLGTAADESHILNAKGKVRVFDQFNNFLIRQFANEVLGSKSYKLCASK